MAAPKGQADLANSQAKELRPDQTLESTPPMEDGVTDGEPTGLISQVDKTETGEMDIPCLFLLLSRTTRRCAKLMEPSKTPLYEKHVEANARIVDFAGWWLPVQYVGILEEHRAVREHAGMFDVSHMGEIRVRGPESYACLQKLLTNTLSGMKDGDVRYSPICYPSGGTVDDVLVYRFSAEEYWLVVNASNKDKDLTWIRENAAECSVTVEDDSAATAEIALQGPAAVGIISELAGPAPAKLGYYEFAEQIPLAGTTALISRTGYTGEDGFEIYCPAEAATIVWDALLAAGTAYGLQPAGLGCRDTLRFEAGMPLYGHELSADISPLEAGLARFVSFEKGEFNGRASLWAQREQGLKRKIVGFEMLERGVARAGYPVSKDGKKTGYVTSGTFAPTIGKNLGMALVEADIGPLGTEIAVEIREKAVRAQTVSRPFSRRGK